MTNNIQQDREEFMVDSVRELGFPLRRGEPNEYGVIPRDNDQDGQLPIRVRQIKKKLAFILAHMHLDPKFFYIAYQKDKDDPYVSIFLAMGGKDGLLNKTTGKLMGFIQDYLGVSATSVAVQRLPVRRTPRAYLMSPARDAKGERVPGYIWIVYPHRINLNEEGTPAEPLQTAFYIEGDKIDVALPGVVRHLVPGPKATSRFQNTLNRVVQQARKVEDRAGLLNSNNRACDYWAKRNSKQKEDWDKKMGRTKTGTDQDS